jgi:hypothetical protein
MSVCVHTIRNTRTLKLSHTHPPIHPSTHPLIQTVGQCKLTYALTPKGKVLAEFTVCFLGGEGEEESFYIVGSRDYTWHDQRCCVVLYCTVHMLHCTHTTPGTIRGAVLYCIVLYCTVLYCTVLYWTVLYCTALYSHAALYSYYTCRD